MKNLAFTRARKINSFRDYSLINKSLYKRKLWGPLLLGIREQLLEKGEVKMHVPLGKEKYAAKMVKDNFLEYGLNVLISKGLVWVQFEEQGNIKEPVLLNRRTLEQL